MVEGIEGARSMLEMFARNHLSVWPVLLAGV